MHKIYNAKKCRFIHTCKIFHGHFMCVHTLFLEIRKSKYYSKKVQSYGELSNKSLRFFILSSSFRNITCSVAEKLIVYSLKPTVNQAY